MNLRESSYDPWKKVWLIVVSHKHRKLRIFVHTPSGVPFRAPLLDVGTAVRGLDSADPVLFISFKIAFLPVPVAARSKTEVFGRSPAEIVGSNPTGGMDVCLLWMLCVVR